MRSRAASCSSGVPTSTATLPARQRWPAAPKAEAVTPAAMTSGSASGMTTIAFFAPPSAWTRLPFSRGARVDVAGDVGGADERDRVDLRVVEEAVDRVAAAVEEVDDAGREVLAAASSTIRSDASGSRSEGLRTTVFPHATANGRNHSGIIAGKLNGVIAATTPTGWRTSSTSTPVATPSRFSPLSRCGTAIAASTTRSRGRPRRARRRASCPCRCGRSARARRGGRRARRGRP